MEIAFSRLDERVAKFTISGVSTSFANMLRRAMISEAGAPAGAHTPANRPGPLRAAQRVHL
jgi:hypothetical protein